MSQREYETQPEAPDLGEEIQQDSGETLVGPPGHDALDAGYVPPDRPLVVEDDQVGSRITDEPEGLDTRLDRERPDVGTGDGPDASTVADAEPDRAPRLAPSSTTAEGGYDESLDAADAGLSGGAASAEEAAVHERDEDDQPREA